MKSARYNLFGLFWFKTILRKFLVLIVIISILVPINILIGQTLTSIKEYYIGTIPEQLVAHGEKLEFRISSLIFSENFEYSIEVSPQQSGNIAFDKSTGLFTYSPAITDTNSFTVNFTAFSKTSEKGTVNDSQTVRITPIFKNEFSNFNNTRPKPDEASSDYVHVSTVKNPVTNNKTFFNTQQPKELLSISVSGKTVIIEKGSTQNNLYEILNNRENIRDLLITAETLIIRSPLTLPQTNVTIYARTLRLEDSETTTPVTINTTPRPWIKNADNAGTPGNENVGADGRSGHNAGNVKLFIKYFDNIGFSTLPAEKRESLEKQIETLRNERDSLLLTVVKSDSSDTEEQKIKAEEQKNKIENDETKIALLTDQLPKPNTKIRFIMKGADGQKAGVGRDGVNGSGAGLIDSPFSNTTYYEIFHQVNGDTKSTESFGNKLDPGNGTPAKGDGAPGSGGNGGDLESTIEIQNTAEQTMGITAPVGKVRIGGKHGEPSPTYWWRKTINYIPGRREMPDRTEISNKRLGGPFYGTSYPDIQPRKLCFIPNDPNESYGCIANTNEVPTPRNGIFKKINVNQEVVWMHPAMIQQMLNYARDLYLDEHFDDTRNLMFNYSRLLKIAAESADNQFKDDFKAQLLESRSLLQRLVSNLDYFGHPAGYAPVLSLEVNLQAYENELDTAIPLLYMTYWLGHKVLDINAKKEALNVGITQLRKDIRNASEQYNSQQDKIGNLERQAEQIEADSRNIRAYLADRERQLEEKAKDDVKTRNELPFWKKTFRTIGALSQVVPVYQPALGTIGRGMQIVSNIDENRPLFPQVVTATKKMTEPGFSQPSRNYRNQLINLGNSTGIKDYARNALPIAERIGEQAEVLSQTFASTQAPADEVEAALSKLKSQDPEFQNWFTKIQKLNSDKQRFKQELETVLQALTNLSDRITTNALAMNAMADENASILTDLSPKTEMYLKEVERRAKERLLQYHYYVAKSYEYRMLERYPNNLNLAHQFDDLLSLASSNDDISNLKNGCDPLGPKESNSNCQHRVVLSSNEFNSLRGVYENPIRIAISQIYQRYNNLTRGNISKVTYELSTSEKKTLSVKGSKLVLNLSRLGLLRKAEEDQRIVSIKSKIEAHNTNSSGNDQNASLKVYFKADPRTVIRYQDKSYAFSLPNSLSWATQYDLKTKIPEDDLPSLGDSSLLHYLMDLNKIQKTPDNIKIFAQPGLAGDLILTSDVIPNGQDINIEIDKLEMTIEYEYRAKNNSVFSLDVQTGDSFKPIISCKQIKEAGNTSDLNGLSSGRASFTRYYSGAARVELVAPADFGNAKFIEWREGGRWDGDNAIEGKFISKDNSIIVTVDSDKIIHAVYSFEPK